jgi:hypothetical protein
MGTCKMWNEIETKGKKNFQNKMQPKKNEKFNMAWRLRGFIIYWLSKLLI